LISPIYGIRMAKNYAMYEKVPLAHEHVRAFMTRKCRMLKGLVCCDYGVSASAKGKGLGRLRYPVGE